MLNKKEWALLSIIAGVTLIFLAFVKKTTQSIMGKIKGNAPEALQIVKSKYGLEFAQDLERVMRLETNHFTSGQWLKCGTAGMVATTTTFPFGWSSLQTFVDKNNLDPKDFWTVHFSKTSEGAKSYIRFPETGLFIQFFADFIQQKRGGDLTKWYRLNDPVAQADYKKKYQSITPKFV